MSSRRPLILMAVLLVLLGAYLARPLWDGVGSQRDAQVASRPPAEPLLPGEDSISNVVVRQNSAGEWQVSFDYYLTGAPAMIRADVDGADTEDVLPRGVAQLYEIRRGHNHATLTLFHPGLKMVTRQVVVEIRGPMPDATTLVSARVDRIIEWPGLAEYQETKEFAQRSPQQNLDQAVHRIDSGASERAKVLLERLVQRDVSFEPAYIELARVAMKTNWGPEGLHHAEGLLSSALQIKPDSVNARILLGYVYTHQERYKLAEKMFAEAVAANPPNIWLWANWGEMLAKQGKFEQAIAKYREAVDRPVSLPTYERARADAYQKLLALLARKRDLDGMEALYKRSVVAFGQSSCQSLKYARFLVQQRGNAADAIELARKSLNVSCWDENAREVLGLAHYVAWSTSEGAARLEAMNQARIYLPPGARAMYLLASSDATVKAAAQLISSGESVDNKDNDRLNALAHAVQNEELVVARRLLRLGASPVTPVGYGDVPVALMPVMSGNLELVKLMRQFGADYAKIAYEGATAFDYAKQAGDTELLQALEPTPRTL